MSFVSVSFLLFLAGVVLLYYCFPLKVRWTVLLAASYGFYLMTDPRYLLYVAATTASTFFCALRIQKINDAGKPGEEGGPDVGDAKEAAARKGRRLLAFALVFNLGILAAVKYLPFLALNLGMAFGLDRASVTFRMLVPLGISFYTFQAAGYVIDVYRGDIRADDNIARYALFLSFFPQIVQGPIARHGGLAAQLSKPQRFNYDSLRSGVQLILWGFLKKLVLADRVALLTSNVFGHSGDYGTVMNAAAILLYGVQIYADFSGGIDIARGAAEMLGIRLARNFKQPYFAQSLNEFWQRWHMTLGKWVKDYLFYPVILSGWVTALSRKARRKYGKQAGRVVPSAIGSFICFFIIGIWHGAEWKYVFYGLYYSILILVSQLVQPSLDRLAVRLRVNTACFSWRLLRVLRTILLVSVARCVTYSAGLTAGLRMLRNTFTKWDPWTLFDGSFYKAGLTAGDFNIVLAGILAILAVDALKEKGMEIRQTLNRQNAWFRFSITLAAALAVLFFGVYGAGYDAAAFIYAQF